jgi:hypothetical protein
LGHEEGWETEEVAGSRSYSKAETQKTPISKEGMEKPGTVITDNEPVPATPL